MKEEPTEHHTKELKPAQWTEIPYHTEANNRTIFYKLIHLYPSITRMETRSLKINKVPVQGKQRIT